MSTELRPRSKNYFLTQFCGPAGPDDRRRLQVTGVTSFRAAYFTVGKDEVAAMVKELTAKVTNLSDPEDTINVHGIELPEVSVKRLCLDLNDWYNDALVEHDY